jgi:hypothetical protein
MSTVWKDWDGGDGKEMNSTAITFSMEEETWMQRDLAAVRACASAGTELKTSVPKNSVMAAHTI